MLAAAVILPPLFFGFIFKDVNQSIWQIWRSMIYDFQTLIGGGFAVAAAYMTINQMRENERRSDARHEEMLVVTGRRDDLFLDRFIASEVEFLSQVSEELSDLATRDPLEAGYSGKITSRLEKVVKRMGSDFWIEASVFFHAEIVRKNNILAASISNLKKTAASLDAARNTFNAAKPAPQRTPPRFVREVYKEKREIEFKDMAVKTQNELLKVNAQLADAISSLNSSLTPRHVRVAPKLSPDRSSPLTKHP